MAGRANLLDRLPVSARRPPRRSACFFSRLVLLVLCVLLGWASLPARAADRIEVVNATLEYRDDGWYVNAEFDFALNPRLEDALIHGLPLYFKTEVELTRPRWYWFDARSVVAETNWRLSYHALTRQYRLSRGTLQLGYRSLEEALGVISRVHNWRVFDKTGLKPGDDFRATIRLRFDAGQLPKPFQISALTNREWTLESEWRRLDVTSETSK